MAALRAVPIPDPDLPGAIRAFNAAQDETNDVVVESEALVAALYLAVASRTHIFVCGSGGVGKTFAAEELSKHFGLEYFYAQFRADMKREEIFGPLSMTRLQHDEYVHVIDDTLVTAQLAVLDEFKDGKAFLRQLLNILNERWFKNGRQRLDVPLITAVGATNFWVEEPELEALFDRLAQRIVQEPVKTSAGFTKIMRAQVDRGMGIAKSRTIVTPEQLAAIHAAVNTCTVGDDVLAEVDKLRKSAEGEKLFMSPRRWGEGVKLARASAVLAGRDHVIIDDLRTFARVLPNHPDDFKTARDLCKAFRDKFTEAVEQARDSLNEQLSKLQPERDKAAAGGGVDMTALIEINKQLKTLNGRVEKAKGEHAGRDHTQLDRVLSEANDASQFIHKQVLGG